MSNQLEKVKELIALRETARLGGGEKRIDLVTKVKVTPHANVLPCCWMREVLKNSICSYNIVVQTSVLKN